MTVVEEDDDLESGAARPQFGGAFTPTDRRSVTNNGTFSPGSRSTASGLNAKTNLPATDSFRIVGRGSVASGRGSAASGLAGAAASPSSQSFASQIDSPNSAHASSARISVTRSLKHALRGNRGKVGTATSNDSIDLKDPSKAQAGPSKRRGCMGDRPIPMWALMIVVNVLCVALVAIGVATSAALLGKDAVQDVASQLRSALLRQAQYAVQMAVLGTEGATKTLAANPNFIALIQSSDGRKDLKAVYEATVAQQMQAIYHQSPQLATISFATRFPSFMGFFPAADFDESTTLILDASSPDGKYFYINGTLAKTIKDFNPVTRPYYKAMIAAGYTAGWTVAYQSQNIGGDFLKPFFLPVHTASPTGNVTTDTIGMIYLAMSANSLRATLLGIPRTANTCFVIIDTAQNGILASTLPIDETINSTVPAARAPYTLASSPNKLLNAAGAALAQGPSADGLYSPLDVGGLGTVDFSVTDARSHVDSMRLLVLVMTPKSDYMGGVDRSNKISVILVVVFSVFGAVLAAMAGLLVSRPLIRLTRLMKKVQKMELSRSNETIVAMSGVREVRNLENGFDQMVLGLRSFEKFVPSAVVKTLLKNSVEADLEVHRRVVTVFFSDVADFTMIAESMKPKNLILLLAEYLTEMSNIIQASEGTVGEFIGDAIMAYWNSPEEVADHASQACNSALKQLATLDTELNKKWKANGWPHISIRCGVNTGAVLHGIIGSRARMKWGLVGDPVNLASRLEALCKRYRVSVCISDSTLALLRPDDFWIFPMDVVAVKGKGKATKLFELAARRGEDTDAALSKKHEAWGSVWNAYATKNWILAREALTIFMVSYANYGPALNMRDRLEEFVKLPPPENWDGVHVLHEK
ncbi:hypothetical protein HDU86_006933 [Geranomyces michiganensis]|nr:hypothetical protein HDU86_006933 [Geranomyces michiganensis]